MTQMRGARWGKKYPLESGLSHVLWRSVEVTLRANLIAIADYGGNKAVVGIDGIILTPRTADLVAGLLEAGWVREPPRAVELRYQPGLRRNRPTNQ
jgi:hypothetical protein